MGQSSSSGKAACGPGGAACMPKRLHGALPMSDRSAEEPSVQQPAPETIGASATGSSDGRSCGPAVLEMKHRHHTGHHNFQEPHTAPCGALVPQSVRLVLDAENPVDDDEERRKRQPCDDGAALARWALLVGWLVLLVLTLVRKPGKAWPLTLATVVLFGLLVLSRNRTTCIIAEKLQAPAPRWCRYATNAVLGASVAGITAVQVVRAAEPVYRLQSVLGASLLLLGSFLCSRNRRCIPWGLVWAGICTNFFLGVLVLQTRPGYRTFKSLGEGSQTFLEFADVGAEFVFGSSYKDHFFAFKVLPIIPFFSAFCSSMYYLGILQFVVRIVATILKVLLGTSMAESVNAAGNVFLGQTEAPLLIRQLLPSATTSEIHCIMTGGFATVAGTVLGAYIGMGVSPEQLIGASVMSAPAALFISKIICPDEAVEDGGSCGARHHLAVEEAEAGAGTGGAGGARAEVAEAEPRPSEPEFKFPDPEEGNLIEAAGNGAILSIGLVANIAVVLIAFLALVAALDSFLGYLGGLLDLPETLSFQLICGYLFFPVAWVLGTPPSDCYQVARLIGTKIFLNEFVAYSDLAALLNNVNGRQISERGELVATYALCGFSNIGSMGVQIGGLGALCPVRRREFASLAVSAMVAGNVVCFFTAAVAGILH